MPIVVPHQSGQAIATANAGQAAQYRSASAFVTPGQENLGQGLQQLAGGLNRFGNAVATVAIERQRMENATDLLADKVAYEDAMRNFESDYRKTRQGVDARTAEQDFAAFHQEQYDILYKKWGGNPFLMEGVDRMAAGLRQPSMGRAVSYRDQQDQFYKQSVLEASRVQAVQIFDDRNISYAEKVKALEGEEANLRLFAGQRLEVVDGKERWTGGTNVDKQIYELRKQFDGAMWGLEKEEYMLMDPAEAVRRIKGATLSPEVDSHVVREAQAQGVNVDLVRAVVTAESAGNSRAVSKAGARGLMQLMPDTAKGLGVDPDDPAQNVKGGVSYLKQQLTKYNNDPRLALAAYNWGPGNVDAWLKTGLGAKGQQIPKETKDYVSKILGADIMALHPDRAGVQGPVPGMVERGNISLADRPVVKNNDGSISTVASMSVNIDNQEVLIPTVSEDGRTLSPKEAVEQYQRTGKHLGKFDDAAHATEYAEKLHQAQESFYVNLDMQKNAPPTPGLRGGTPLERQAFLEQQMKRLETQQKAQREQFISTTYDSIHAQLKGMNRDEQDRIFTSSIAQIPDKDVRTQLKTMWDRDREIDTLRQKSLDTDLARRFETLATEQGLNYAQQLAEIQKLRGLGLSEEGERKLRERLEKGGDKETKDNITQTDNLRRYIDEGKVKTPEQIDEFAFFHGLTKGQKDDVKKYLAEGGQEGALWQVRSKVDAAMKFYQNGKGLDKDPEFYKTFQRAIEPGVKLTDDYIRKTVRTMLLEQGERKDSGFVSYGYGRDMTYGEAVAAGHKDDWLPTVDDKTSARIREEFRQQGINDLTDMELRWIRRKELGLPVPEDKLRSRGNK